MDKNKQIQKAFEVYKEICEALCKIRKCYNTNFLYCELRVISNGRGDIEMTIEIPEAKMLSERIPEKTSGSPRIVRKSLLEKLRKIVAKTKTQGDA